MAFQLFATTPASSTRTCSFDLPSNEGGTHGGHTIARHVNQSDAQLRARLANDRSLTQVSTYTSLAQAQRLTDSTVCSTSNKAILDAWLAEPGRKDGDRRTVTKTFSSVTGTIMKADGKTKINAYRVVVVVRKNSAMPAQIGILTSFPN